MSREKDRARVHARMHTHTDTQAATYTCRHTRGMHASTILKYTNHQQKQLRKTNTTYGDMYVIDSCHYVCVAVRKLFKKIIKQCTPETRQPTCGLPSTPHQSPDTLTADCVEVDEQNTSIQR